MDEELVAKKLAFIETCVRELRDLANLDRMSSDVRERRFVEHTLQLAIQSALDVGSHLVSDRRLGEPTTNRGVFDSLVSGGYLPEGLAATLGDMAGFRNVLVHGYTAVDLDIVRDVVNNHLSDLEAFADAMRGVLK